MSRVKEELIAQVNHARANCRNVALEPPMSPESVAALEGRSRAPLPPDIRELVEYTAGFVFEGISIDFHGEQPFEFECVVPRGVPISTDGAGNFWVVDARTDGSWGPVLFIAHDPPVVVVQAPDLAVFWRQVFAAKRVEDIADSYVSDVWKRNQYVMRRSEALASPDATLRMFAEQVGEGFVVADLRKAETGSGFVWALAGPRSQIRRERDQLLFAIEQKKPGLFNRLFSAR